jgi:siroheme synthase
VTIVENGTLADERILEAEISDLNATIRAKSIAGPAIIYVGLSRQARSTVVSFPARRAAS